MLQVPSRITLAPGYDGLRQIRTAVAHRVVSAGDSPQYGQRGSHVRCRRGEAVAGPPAGFSPGRLLFAPRGARLLAAPGVGSRRRLGRLARETAPAETLVLYENG